MQDIVAVHMALKISSELRQSYPQRLIKEISYEVEELPTIHFLRTKFFNFGVPTGRETLLARTHNATPILIGPLSSVAWCIVNTVHRGLMLPRRSVCKGHLGYGRTQMVTEKFCRILALLGLVKEVRRSYLHCRLMLDRTVPIPQGKVHDET